MNFYFIFSKVAVIFLLLMTGFVLKKKNIVGENAQKELTSVLLYALLPCALVKSFNIDYNQHIFITGITITGIMALVYTFSFILSKVVTNKFKVSQGEKDIYAIATVLPNVGFMGYPIVEAFFGPQAIIFAVMGNLAFETFSWTKGISTVAKTSSTPITESFLKMLIKTPAMIAIFLGLLIFVTPLHISEPFISTINLLGGAMSPVAMIIVGITLATANGRDSIKNPYALVVTFLKLIIIPILTMISLRLFGATGMLYAIPIILVSMPTAGYVSIFASKHQVAAPLASEIVFLSTLLSMLTIPLLFSIFGI